MGFDLYGRRAVNKNGEYFRNNVWWWRPLWNFIAVTCNDILTPLDIENGSFNMGHIITKKKAEAIAERINEYVKDGRLSAYAKTHRELMRKAKKNNKTHQVGDPEYDWNEAYPFSITNVKDFAQFCKDSGGFTIF